MWMITILFLLSAFAIGITNKGTDIGFLNSAIDNASIVVNNMTLPNSTNPYLDGVFRVTESFTKFCVTTGMEITRAGVLFGHDNPQYFEANFIISIMKMLVWITIVRVAFVPIMYSIAFLIMLGIWIKDKIKKNGKTQT